MISTALRIERLSFEMEWWMSAEIKSGAGEGRRWRGCVCVCGWVGVGG
jgi:hypothetical protein